MIKKVEKVLRGLDFLLPLAYKYNCMNYLRSDIDTLVSRRDWLFTPTISYSFRGANGKNWQLAYNMEVTTPDLKQTIRVTDTSKPLSVIWGMVICRILRRTVSRQVMATLYRN